MRDNECNIAGNTILGAGTASDCCAQRESAQSVLRNRATHMRDYAMQLLEDAKRIEQLANFTAGISGLPEEALYRLAMDAQFGRPPRAF